MQRLVEADAIFHAVASWPRQLLHGKVSRFRSINSVLVLRMTNADCWRLRLGDVQQSGSFLLRQVGRFAVFSRREPRMHFGAGEVVSARHCSQHGSCASHPFRGVVGGCSRHRGPVWRARYWRAAGAKVFNAKQLQ